MNAEIIGTVEQSSKKKKKQGKRRSIRNGVDGNAKLEIKVCF